MFRELRPLKEIHEIQEKLAVIHREAEEAKKKYDFTLRKASYVK